MPVAPPTTVNVRDIVDDVDAAITWYRNISDSLFSQTPHPRSQT